MPRAKSVWLWTNRNVSVFDEHGAQIAEVQAELSCYSLDKVVAQRVIDEADEFYVAKWNGWQHPISKREMEYLLGLRTRERDLNER